MRIEDELKKLNTLEIKPQNENFKLNLRKRLINEYVVDEVANTKAKFFRIKFDSTLLQKLFRANSTLNYAILLMASFVVLGVGATYVAVPQDIKDNIYYSLKNEKPVKINSNVSGADVYVNGEYKGTTPIKLGLSVGSYVIRIQKDGYGVYSKNIVINDESIEVKAQLDKLENEIYAGWLTYNNEDLNFMFNYPADWQINEYFQGDDYSNNYVVALSNEDNEILFTFNPDSPFSLVRDNVSESYKREIEINGTPDNRYLQFNQDGALVNAGMNISFNDTNIAKIEYKISGSSADILTSQALNVMDKISSSIIFDGNSSIVAFGGGNTENNGESNIKIELEPEDEVQEDEIIAQVNNQPKEPGILNVEKVGEKEYTSYVNNVYGYQITYAGSEWNKSTSRAYYPLKSRGYTIALSDGTEDTISLFKLRSDRYGTINIFTGINKNQVYESDWDLCKSGKSVSAGNYTLNYVTENSSFDFQVCQNGNGQLSYNSMKSGQVVYAIFISDVATKPLDTESLSAISEVINSFKISDDLMQFDFNTTQLSYNIPELGKTFDYPFNYAISADSVVCMQAESEAECKNVTVRNDVNDRVMNFVINGKYVFDTKDYAVESNIISFDGANFEYNEYYEQSCEDEDNCIKKDFVLGVVNYNSTSIIYYAPIQANNNIKEILISLR